MNADRAHLQVAHGDPFVVADRKERDRASLAEACAGSEELGAFAASFVAAPAHCYILDHPLGVEDNHLVVALAV